MRLRGRRRCLRLSVVSSQGDTSAPRAFVVMPFGTKNVPPADGGAGETRAVDFDALYDDLLAPALRIAGCEPFRADEEAAAGDIRTDMFFELVTADVVIADISILNPNVFYELGVRHGVAERGVFMIHAGWSRRPFDVAPDRTFSYDGSLFVGAPEHDDAWDERRDAEIGRLASTLRAALAVDDQTVGSPVYKELKGLKPVDWSAIDTARAKYFSGVLDDWRERVRVARRNGRAEDVLTLARDAPTRFHRDRLLVEAAKALVDLQRFDVARSVLEDLLELDPDNFAGSCQLALVLGRLGLAAEAEARIARVLTTRPNDPEAQGALGRIHKDAWRSTWSTIEDLAARQARARQGAARARQAIRSYERAHRNNLDSYYNGINVVGLTLLLEHLDAPAGTNTCTCGPAVQDLAAVVRVAAREELRRSHDAGSEENAIWPAATLGELELLLGDQAQAVELYVEATAAAGVTRFQVESMLSQLELYDRLGLKADVVAAVRDAVAPAREAAIPPAPSYLGVVICSGHMIDTPDRPKPRFPPEAEDEVRERLAAELDGAGVAEGTLAICGGARGADILFAELALERGAHLRLLLPLPAEEFRMRSVRLAGDGGAWEKRFNALLSNADVAVQTDRLGRPPVGMDVFARNNLWILDSARAEAGARGFAAIVVWDQQPTGDGPGGTSDFARRAERMSTRFAIVNPTTLAVVAG